MVSRASNREDTFGYGGWGETSTREGKLTGLSGMEAQKDMAERKVNNRWPPASHGRAWKHRVSRVSNKSMRPFPIPFRISTYTFMHILS